MTVKERILQVAKAKGFKVELFCEKIGMSYGNFKGSAKKRPINSTAIEKILSIIPELNLNWLFTGEGEMFNNLSILHERPPTYNKTTEHTLYLEQKIDSQSKELREAYKEIGRLEGLIEANKKQTCQVPEPIPKSKLTK